MIPKSVVLLLFIIMLSGTALANDPEPGTPEDNACHTGGNMEGKCDTYS